MYRREQITVDRVIEEIGDAIKFDENPEKEVRYISLSWRDIGDCDDERWAAFVSNSGGCYVSSDAIVVSSKLSPDDLLQLENLAICLIEGLKKQLPPEPRLLKRNKESKDNG